MADHILRRAIAATRQPQSTPKIDWANPLTRDLVFCYVPSVGPTNLVSGTKASSSGTISALTATGRGLAFDNSGSSAVIYWQEPSLTVSPNLTHLAVQDITSISTWGGLFCSAVLDGSSGLVTLQKNSSTTVMRLYYGPSYSTLSRTVPQITSAGTVCRTVTATPENRKYYEDGRLVETAASGLSALSGIGIRFVLHGERGASTSSQSVGRSSVFLSFNRELTADEIKSLSDNPYQIFKENRYIIDSTAVGGDTDVSATTDALAITENAATISFDVGVSATTDALTITTYTASLSADTEVSATTDTLTITENAASISFDVTVSAGFDALSITTQPATVSTASGDTTVSASFDSLLLIEYSATVSLDVSVSANTDTLAITEYAATVSNDVGISATTDALSITENAATITYDVNVLANYDALVITGYAATVTSAAATYTSKINRVPFPVGALGLPVYIQDSQPSTTAEKYLWIDTTGGNLSFKVEDGT